MNLLGTQGHCHTLADWMAITACTLLLVTVYDSHAAAATPSGRVVVAEGACLRISVDAAAAKVMPLLIYRLKRTSPKLERAVLLCVAPATQTPVALSLGMTAVVVAVAGSPGALASDDGPVTGAQRCAREVLAKWVTRRTFKETGRVEVALRAVAADDRCARARNAAIETAQKEKQCRQSCHVDDTSLNRRARRKAKECYLLCTQPPQPLSDTTHPNQYAGAAFGGLIGGVLGGGVGVSMVLLGGVKSEGAFYLVLLGVPVSMIVGARYGWIRSRPVMAAHSLHPVLSPAGKLVGMTATLVHIDW